MIQELKNKIKDEFPHLFIGKSPSFDCGDGWFGIIHDTCRRIIELGQAAGDFSISQIKEKYARLNIYGNPTNCIIDEILREAEEESGNVCERCGSKDGVRLFIYHGWEQVGCLPCRKMIKRGWHEGCAEFNDEEKVIVREMLERLRNQLHTELDAAFPGGRAEVNLRSGARSYIVVKDAEGRIYAA